MINKAILTLTLSAFAITACGQVTKEARQEIDTNVERADSLLDNLSAQTNNRAASTIIDVDGIFVGDTAIELENGVPFEPLYDDITFAPKREITLNEVLQLITARYKVPFSILDNAADASSGEQLVASPLPKITPPDLLRSFREEEASTGPTEPTIRLNFRGKLADLIDLVATRFGYDWTRDKNLRVQLFRYQSETYRVRALGGGQTINAALSSTSAPQSAGGSGGNAGNNFQAGMQSQTTYTAALNFWDKLKQDLDVLIGDRGTVSVNDTLGTVSVRAPRQVQRIIRDKINEMNADLVRSAVFSIEILKLDLNAAEQAGFNMNFAYGNAGSHPFGYQSTNMLPTALTDGAGGALQAQILEPSHPFFGTSLKIEALKKSGALSVFDQGSMLVKNHISAQFQSVDINTYLAKVETTITGDNRTTETLTPGTTTPGLTINVLASILPNGEMDIRFDLSIATDRGRDTVGSGNSGSVIQTPRSSGVSTSTQGAVKAGKTLMMSGFDRLAHAIDEAQGLVSGATKQASKNRNVMIVLVTPHLLATQ